MRYFHVLHRKNIFAIFLIFIEIYFQLPLTKNEAFSQLRIKFWDKCAEKYFVFHIWSPYNLFLFQANIIVYQITSTQKNMGHFILKIIAWPNFFFNQSDQ